MERPKLTTNLRNMTGDRKVIPINYHHEFEVKTPTSDLIGSVAFTDTVEAAIPIWVDLIDQARDTVRIFLASSVPTLSCDPEICYAYISFLRKLRRMRIEVINGYQATVLTGRPTEDRATVLIANALGPYTIGMKPRLSWFREEWQPELFILNDRGGFWYCPSPETLEAAYSYDSEGRAEELGRVFNRRYSQFPS